MMQIRSVFEIGLDLSNLKMKHFYTAEYRLRIVKAFPRLAGFGGLADFQCLLADDVKFKRDSSAIQLLDLTSSSYHLILSAR